MKNTFFKGLIMTVVAFVASYIADNQEIGIEWAYVGISSIGIALTYIGKNAWYQSDSSSGTINWGDMFSGLIIAVGTAISSGAASFIVAGSVDWPQIGTAVISVILGYFAKTFITNKGVISN